MKTKNFSFDLPTHLIAQHPPERRGASRLMVIHRSTGVFEHTMVADLPRLLEPGSVVVFNNSRVRKARLVGRRLGTGGRGEFLLVDRVDSDTWRCLAKNAARRRNGEVFEFPDGLTGTISGEAEDGAILMTFSRTIDDEYLDRNGQVPLPPYIRRQPDEHDDARYQTVYAAEHGSIAAPTAGLHFTADLIEALRARGVDIRFVTLHVGIGTFLPVRTDEVESHTMHEERYTVPEDTARAVTAAKSEGRAVVAVGTTAVRTLESAGTDGCIVPGDGTTSLFIYPGYSFQIVDQMFTNFHTPESSLFVMVSAFAGLETMKAAYRAAVDAEYRFFSYGDACLIR